MAEDRNTLEQQAMAHLGKGKPEEALKSYQAILRLEPRDVRIRQKIADLYMQLGNKPQAMRQLREVAVGHIGEDQHRQALVVLKQLQKLKPKDDEVYGLLGDCYKAVGFLPDAREAYEKTLELLEVKPKEALPYAAKLMSIAPGEMPPKINHAELLQRSGKLEEAAQAWKRLGIEARRRGNGPDQALFNERSLRLEEDDLDCLEGAAEARISMGEAKEALVHIQKAYAANPSSEQVLSMLAQCFELMDQQPKAKKVLLQLAKLYEDQNKPVGRRDALQRAFACDAEDADLKAEVGEAVARAERFEMRLTDHKWSEAKDEDQERVLVEAEVLVRYGFADRAKSAIEAASDEVRDSLAIRARLVEVLAELDDREAAVEALGALEVDAAGDAQIIEAVQIRLGALKGHFDAPDGSVSASVDDDEDEEVVELDIEDEEDEEGAEAKGGDSEARGDELAAAGDTAGAMAAYQQALAADPTNEEVLMKLGELVAGGEEDEEEEGDSPPVDLPPEALSPVEEDEDEAEGDMPDFKSIFKGGAQAPDESAPSPEIATPPPSVAGGEAAEEARANILIGRFDEALKLLEGGSGLSAAVLSAEARMLNGDAAGARKALRRALDDSDDGDPATPEALWLLARLQAMTGKGKAAGRTLDDLEDGSEDYRSVDVAALRRGLDLLKGR